MWKRLLVAWPEKPLYLNCNIIIIIVIIIIITGTVITQELWILSHYDLISLLIGKNVIELLERGIYLNNGEWQ